MKNQQYSSWTISAGDYQRASKDDYEKQMKATMKREKISIRILTSAVIGVSLILLLAVLYFLLKVTNNT